MDGVEWAVMPLADFDTGMPRDPGALGGELMAQIRNNSRILDNFRFALGGTAIITAEFTSKDLFATKILPSTPLTFKARPNQIVLRKNMLSSAWMDVLDLVRSQDLLVTTDDSGDENDDFLELIEALEDKDSVAAAIRWAVGVGADNRLELQLQALPGTADSLNSKPLLKG
jgi:hypothetical protein